MGIYLGARAMRILDQALSVLPGARMMPPRAVRVSMIWVASGELFVAEGAVVGLEDGAEEERVDAGVLFALRQTSTGLRLWSSGMARAWMAEAMVCHWMVSGKTKEKSRSTAW